MQIAEPQAAGATPYTTPYTMLDGTADWMRNKDV